MKIDKTDTTPFGTVYIIKTKKPAILNALEDFDHFTLKKMNPPKCKYWHTATSSPQQDGFFWGYLDDFNKKDTREKSIVIRNVEDLAQIPILEEHMAKLKQKIKDIIG